MAYKSESAVLKWAIYFVLFQIDYRWRRGFKIKVLDSVFFNRKWNSRGEVEFFFRSWARNFIDEKIHLTLHCKRLGIDGWKFSSWSKYNCVSFGLVPFDPGFPIPSVEKTKIPALVNRDRSFFLWEICSRNEGKGICIDLVEVTFLPLIPDPRGSRLQTLAFSSGSLLSGVFMAGMAFRKNKA